MTMESATGFADAAENDPDLRARLDAVAATDPQARIDALVQIGAQAGYTFTPEDYYISASARAMDVNQRWPPQGTTQDAASASSAGAYAQYGFPNSAFPPIPPPMPTYLPPPPYIPLPSAGGEGGAP